MKRMKTHAIPPGYAPRSAADKTAKAVTLPNRFYLSTVYRRSVTPKTRIIGGVTARGVGGYVRCSQAVCGEFTSMGKECASFAFVNGSERRTRRIASGAAGGILARMTSTRPADSRRAADGAFIDAASGSS